MLYSKDKDSENRSHGPLYCLVLGNEPGYWRRRTVIELDKQFSKGIGHQIAIPEISEHPDLFSQRIAVHCGGNKTSSSAATGTRICGRIRRNDPLLDYGNPLISRNIRYFLHDP